MKKKKRLTFSHVVVKCEENWHTFAGGIAILKTCKHKHKTYEEAEKCSESQSGRQYFFGENYGVADSETISKGFIPYGYICPRPVDPRFTRYSK